MKKLKGAVSFETAFSEYKATELLGEGGSGRVYGGTGADGTPVAIKVLAADRVTSDKRKRFKNELAFLSKARHSNIVPVLDHGLLRVGDSVEPFYVMQRYECSLRALLANGIQPDQALVLLGQLLDGVEAAHLLGVCHRDLKPENLLYDSATKILAIADFGVASFTDELLVTLVETRPSQRLANFQYAAPEQRSPGRRVTQAADLYAIGLIANEMFTGEVPHGTGFKTVSSVAQRFAFLDPVIGQLLRQEPSERPASIEVVKRLIQSHRSEAVVRQKLGTLSQTVIPVQQVDEPLALDPPRLIGIDWSDGTLTLQLDRPVTQGWVEALRHMGSYTSVWGREPGTFRFQEDRALVQASGNEVQKIVDCFKAWLPRATEVFKLRLEQEAAREEAEQKRKLAEERAHEERRLRILQSVKI